MDIMRIGTKLLDTEIMSIPDEPEQNLRALQELVGGHIETCPLAELRDRGILLLANEEGLLQGLEPNINLCPFFFVGQLVAVGFDGDEFTGLGLEQTLYLAHWLNSLID